MATMLHWLAGAKSQDERASDPDSTGYIDPPQTPAPVFAVRAFKQALFGTPQTQQQPPKARRHSVAEQNRPRNVEQPQRQARPRMDRPRSASDAVTFARPDTRAPPEPIGSPTKGILMTPGTAAARKKNVTFGNDVQDNEGKRPSKAGVPVDGPENSASPFVREGDALKDDIHDSGRGRNKLTEKLEQARDESRQRKPTAATKADENVVHDSGDYDFPQSDSGKYWKQEYDLYRTNTQREVKKLITKQKAAKSFAMAKDTECTTLADDLRQEKRKADVLETAVQDLTSQLREMEAQLSAAKEAERKLAEENATLKRRLGRGDTAARPGSSEGLKAFLERRGSNQRTATSPAFNTASPRSNSPSKLADDLQVPSEPYKPLSKPVVDSTASRHRPLSREKESRPDISADIWAQSSPTVEQKVPSPPTKPTKTDAKPLSTMSANARSGSMSEEPPKVPEHKSQTRSKPTFERKDSKTDTWKDGPLLAPSLPSPQRETPPQSQTKPLQSRPRPERTTSTSVEPSGSMRAEPSRPRPERMTSTTVEASDSIRAEPSRSKPDKPALQLKPSAMWGSIGNAKGSGEAGESSQGRRQVSMVAKDGREVDAARLEAAKARLQARGRNVT